MSLQEIIEDKTKVHMLAKAAFEAVDTDGSGYLERNELEAVMSSVSLELDFEGASKEDVDEILSELDENSDGKSKEVDL